MTKSIGRESWTVLLLLYIGLFMLAWSVPSFAAELKDVRLGEYTGFTRIVFELDEPAIKPDIKIQSSNHLLVTFKKTIANLVRHIPVKRSPHVDDIQFWQHKSSLSTLLIFDYPHIRLESFRLSHPPRFAVDVFPVAEPVEEKSTGTAAPDQIDPKSNVHGMPTPDDMDNLTPTAISKETAPPPGTTLPIEDDKSASSEYGGPSPESTASGDSSTVGGEENIQAPMLPSPPSESPHGIKQKTDNIAQKTPSPNNRLQFYLVIILVIITIAILFLLLLMLLTRHKLFYDKAGLSTAEIARHQDKNIIPETDSNRKEQLKRYDEA